MLNPLTILFLLAIPSNEITILPARITLTSPATSQRLIVETTDGSQYVGDSTARATFHSSNPRVASVDKEGSVRSIANGTVEITARIGAQTARALVTVKLGSPSWLFRNHVLSVITKAGCNSGACHGASAGKGGFKLTLRGFDPLTDYFTLTRQALARRVNTIQPEESLVLLKPTASIPHGGGLRLQKDSIDYRVVLSWIKNGTIAPKDSDPQIQRLEVIPAQVTLKAKDTQQILVRAHFSDGHMEDVTRWVKFGTTDTTVASVDDNGKVTVSGHGETAVTIWYLSLVSFATVTVPYTR